MTETTTAKITRWMALASEEAKLRGEIEAEVYNAPAQDKLNYWYVLDNFSGIAGNSEKKLRGNIFTQLFPNPKTGVNRLSVGHGKDLIAEYKINLTVDAAGKRALEENKAKIPLHLYESVLKFKPEVSVTGYNAMTVEEKVLWSDIITAKPGLPSLKIDNEKKR